MNRFSYFKIFFTLLCLSSCSNVVARKSFSFIYSLSKTKLSFKKIWRIKPSVSGKVSKNVSVFRDLYLYAVIFLLHTVRSLI